MLTHAQHASPTAVICENLEYFGGGPNRGEPDPRAVWDEAEALAGLDTILDAFVEEVAPDGTQLADERESLLWGFVNTLHMQTVRLDRAVDKLSAALPSQSFFLAPSALTIGSGASGNTSRWRGCTSTAPSS